MSALRTFASLLGVAEHQAEDALHSERVARAVLSRRSFIGAAAALVVGTTFTFPEPPKLFMPSGGASGELRWVSHSEAEGLYMFDVRSTHPSDGSSVLLPKTGTGRWVLLQIGWAVLDPNGAPAGRLLSIMPPILG